MDNLSIEVNVTKMYQQQQDFCLIIADSYKHLRS